MKKFWHFTITLLIFFVIMISQLSCSPSIFLLNVSQNPTFGGTVTPSSGTYQKGTTITVTAKPANGYEFSHWEGGVGGSSSSVQILMDSDKNIIAYFNKIVPIVSITDLLVKSSVNDIDSKQQWQRIYDTYNGVRVKFSGSLRAVRVDSSGPYVDIQQFGDWITAHFKKQYEQSMGQLKYGALVQIEGECRVEVPSNGRGRIEFFNCDLIQVLAN